MCISAAAVAAIAAVTSAAASAASIGMSVVAGKQQEDALEERDKYERAKAHYNSVAIDRMGDIEKVKQGIRQRKEFGDRRLAAATKGLDISFGSTARRLDETRQFHAIDSALLARNVKAKVVGVRQGLMESAFNNDIARQNARLGMGAGIVRGTAGLAGAISDFANTGIIDFASADAETESPTQTRNEDYVGGYSELWMKYRGTG